MKFIFGVFNFALSNIAQLTIKFLTNVHDVTMFVRFLKLAATIFKIQFSELIQSHLPFYFLQTTPVYDHILTKVSILAFYDFTRIHQANLFMISRNRATAICN